MTEQKTMISVNNVSKSFILPNEQSSGIKQHLVNKLKGKVTILFITHQLPKGLQVDEAVILGKENTDAAKNTNNEELTKP